MGILLHVKVTNFWKIFVILGNWTVHFISLDVSAKTCSLSTAWIFIAKKRSITDTTDSYSDTDHIDQQWCCVNMWGNVFCNIHGSRKWVDELVRSIGIVFCVIHKTNRSWYRLSSHALCWLNRSEMNLYHWLTNWSISAAPITSEVGNP